jgi:hypothetical protein
MADALVPLNAKPPNSPAMAALWFCRSFHDKTRGVREDTLPSTVQREVFGMNDLTAICAKAPPASRCKARHSFLLLRMQRAGTRLVAGVRGGPIAIQLQGRAPL